MTKIITPITLIDRPFSLADHQREILRLAFAFDRDGRLPYDTIIYSTVKKAGKTTINGGLTLWWACTQEAPNETVVITHKPRGILRNCRR